MYQGQSRVSHKVERIGDDFVNDLAAEMGIRKPSSFLQSKSSESQERQQCEANKKKDKSLFEQFSEAEMTDESGDYDEAQINRANGGKQTSF